MILADTSLPEPSHWQSVAWVVTALFTAALGAEKVWSWWQRITRPNGTDAIHRASQFYQPKGDYVTRQELQDVKRELTSELETIRREIGDMETRMSEASEERIRRVHQRLDTIPDRIITQLSTLGLLRRPDQP